MTSLMSFYASPTQFSVTHGCYHLARSVRGAYVYSGIRLGLLVSARLKYPTVKVLQHSYVKPNDTHEKGEVFDYIFPVKRRTDS